jgi:3-oxo-5-alpha-steroid 4-dehydrogenase 1
MLDTIHLYTCYTLLFLAPIVFCVLHFGGQKAEYGRYSLRKAQGLLKPIVPGRADWFLHATSLLSVYLVYTDDSNAPPPPSANNNNANANKIVLCLFILHYLWRSIGFAMMVQNPKPMSIPLALSTSGFCLLNGWLQARTLLHHANLNHSSPTTSPYTLQFYIGIVLFFVGWLTNIHSDWILIHLRSSPADKGYYIPHGGMFQYVSGANFLGEIIEWIGFAVASNFALPCVTFALFTFANLAPRAYQHHQWYINKFKEEYQTLNRKALIPYVW